MKNKFTKEIPSNIKWLFLVLSIGLLLYTNLRNFFFPNEKILSFSIMAVIVITLTILYYFLLKYHKKIFTSKRQIIFFIILIACVFALMIPHSVKDIYSYIGCGWTAANYYENPYEMSAQEIENKYNVQDNMYENIATVWKSETMIYGPLWTLICSVLTALSFGNVTIALFLFKLFNLGMHLLSCFMIHKITKKKMLVLLYALNPIILLEGLMDVHNEIFMITLILCAIYYTIRKKNLWIAVLFLALATAVKYFAILLLPFLVLYLLKEKTIGKRIGYCILAGIEFLGILCLFYLIYFQDFSFLNVFSIQQNKYNSSIYYILYRFIGENATNIIKWILLVIFIIGYIGLAIQYLLKRKTTFRKLIRKYEAILFLFIFFLITNFNSWYLLWLVPTIFWLKPRHIKYLLILYSFAYILKFFTFCMGETAIIGIPYFLGITIIPAIIALDNTMKLRKRRIHI